MISGLSWTSDWVSSRSMTRSALAWAACDYRQRSQLWLQSSLGYVLQSPHLFSGSVAGLVGIETVVLAPLGHQLLVSTALPYASVVDHQDPVGGTDGTQTMGHHEAGPARQHRLDGILDKGLHTVSFAI